MTRVPALEARDVVVRYPGAAADALAGVDLEVHGGEVHALLGQNGAGKSTLMHVLGGVIAPSRGTVAVHGRPFAPRDPADARRAGVALIHQELALAPHLSVEANVLLGNEPTRGGVFLARRRARALAHQALAELGRVDVPLGARVRDLEPSTRQLVEIARALSVGARVLLLDEPTSSLSRGEVEPLFALLRSLRDRGTALVYISHALDEVRAIASRFTVVRDGRVASAGALVDASDAQVVAAMVGRDLTAMYARGPRRPGDVVLRIEGLQLDAVRGQEDGPPPGLHLELRRGEVLGIAGLVGAGRTELLRAVFGLDAVRTGGVRVGSLVQPPDPSRMWRAGVGFVSEDRKSEGLAVRASLADNVTWPRLDLVARCGFLSPRRSEAATRALVARLGIRCQTARQPVHELSGGNQQKVALARLLFAGCDVLLLDEPTRGIDVGAKAEVYRLLDELVANGAAALLVSSYLPELLGVCDRIAVMRHGRLLPPRPVNELDEAGLLLAAAGGRGAT